MTPAAERRDPHAEWIHPALVSSNESARLLGFSPTYPLLFLA
jgi:hypothetical protein